MVSRFRTLCTIFAVGMAIGIGGLLLLPSADKGQWDLFAVKRTSDALGPRCEKTWPNADRKCLPWTAPLEKAQDALKATDDNSHVEVTADAVSPEDAFAEALSGSRTIGKFE